MTADLKQGNRRGRGVPQAQYRTLEHRGRHRLKGTPLAVHELSFNCYDSPDSMGNPVLLDRFRQALEWAVDRERS